MNVFDIDQWREVGATLGKNRLRTGLTALGVFLGILILMVMVWFGLALASGVNKQMGGYTTNAVFVWAQRTSVAHAGFGPNRRIELTMSDAQAVAALPGIDVVAPRAQAGGFMQGSNVRRGAETGSFQVVGDTPQWSEVQVPLVRVGRLLNESDVVEQRKICVIGEAVRDQMFGVAPAIGDSLEISGISFTVVGIVGTRAKGRDGDRVLNTIQLPITTFQQVFGQGEKIGWMALIAKPSADAESVEQSVRELLAARQRFAPLDEQAIGTRNAKKEFSRMQAMFAAIHLVMWGAGIISLAAGVIGVASIMLISVKERTREIGVRKALGARRAHIIGMVLAESAVLTTTAGALGLIAGALLTSWAPDVLATLGDDVPLGPALVPLGTALAALAVLVFFGVLAGVLPAAAAAKVDPVEALRTE